jgi:hypothetical protein
MRPTSTVDSPGGQNAMTPRHFALILGLCLTGACAIAAEEPAFTVSLAQGDFEVRAYSALVVAQVSVTGDRKAAASSGFRLLAGYIFGGNTAQQKIAMTAPVMQAASQKIPMTAPVLQSESDGAWVISFIMPKGSTLENLPRPNNPKVQIKTVPPARMAVVRFSGLARPDTIAAKTAALQGFVTAQHLHAIGPPALAQYDPPWTLWFLRRNELVIPIASDAAG